MSEETNAFTADLHINGKKVGYVRNDGHGGCTDYNINSHILKAEAYCRTLPKIKYGDMEWDNSLENHIDQLFEDWLEAKERKKMEKRMRTGILVGKPDALQYSFYNFQRPLTDFPQHKLQAGIARIQDKLKAGEVILNTNLQELGLNV